MHILNPSEVLTINPILPLKISNLTGSIKIENENTGYDEDATIEIPLAILNITSDSYSKSYDIKVLKDPNVEHLVQLKIKEKTPLKSGLFVTNYTERGRRIAQDKFAGKIVDYKRDRLTTLDCIYTFANINNIHNTRGLRVDEIYVEENCPLSVYLDCLLPLLKPDGKIHRILESE